MGTQSVRGIVLQPKSQPQPTRHLIGIGREVKPSLVRIHQTVIGKQDIDAVMAR
jgi:hypothetical protein